MKPTAKSAVLLTCHGTVSRTEDIPAFLSNIRRGRPASDELVREVQRRFEVIGGSPLMEHTEAQAQALEARLGVPVRAAGRLWGPYPRDVLTALHAEGVRHVVSLPLAPQSVDVYHATVREAAVGLEGLSLSFAASWGAEPALIDAFVEAIDAAVGSMAGDERAPDGRSVTAVVLTAHSLPMRVLASGDPYERQFRAMAELVAARIAPRHADVRIAFQSQGMDGGEWLGPDLERTLRELAAAGTTRAVVAPIGFVAEHVETLYDLDVEGPIIATRSGLAHFARSRAPNATSKFIDALEAVARPLLEGTQAVPPTAA